MNQTTQELITQMKNGLEEIKHWNHVSDYEEDCHICQSEYAQRMEANEKRM